MKLIPYGKHHIDADDIEAVVRVLESDFLTQGPMVEVFENAIAEYCDVKYAVAVSSGTAALHIAVLALGISSADRLVTSPITFVASANAGVYAGSRIGFADIDSENVNISPLSLQSVLEKYGDVKVVVPVHYAGLPCDMVSIGNVCNQYQVSIIEDAAHALGARYKDGTKVGNCKYSDMTIFSLHPVKSIAAGEGGLITTNDEDLYKKLLRLRSHGINKLDDEFVVPEIECVGGEREPWYYEMQTLGFNYRITDIQCALALSQLKKLDTFVKKRERLVSRYDMELSTISQIRPAQDCDKKNSSHHLYPIRIDFKKLGISRKSAMNQLLESGIATQIHYIPVPFHPFYRNMGFNLDDYPAALAFYQESLSIPLYVDLKESEQDLVISSLNNLVS
jgi:perosamine synthetase